MVFTVINSLIVSRRTHVVTLPPTTSQHHHNRQRNGPHRQRRTPSSRVRLARQRGRRTTISRALGRGSLGAGSSRSRGPSAGDDGLVLVLGENGRVDGILVARARQRDGADARRDRRRRGVDGRVGALVPVVVVVAHGGQHVVVVAVVAVVVVAVRQRGCVRDDALCRAGGWIDFAVELAGAAEWATVS